MKIIQSDGCAGRETGEEAERRRRGEYGGEGVEGVASWERGKDGTATKGNEMERKEAGMERKTEAEIGVREEIRW